MGDIVIGSGGSAILNSGGSLKFTEWQPTNIAGCVLWLRSDLAWQDAEKAVPCVNESLIWTGEDKSLDNDIIQATEAARPIYFANGDPAIINGHPFWRFDGIDDWLRSVAFTWNQPEVIYMVLNQITWTSTDIIFDGFGASYVCLLQQYPASGDLRIYAGGAVEGVNLPVDSFGIIRAIFNGATSSIRLNNNSPVEGNAGTSNAGGFTLGSQYEAPGYCGNFDFVEAFGYNVVPTSEEDASAMAYLNARYAIY